MISPFLVEEGHSRYDGEFLVLTAWTYTPMCFQCEEDGPAEAAQPRHSPGREGRRQRRRGVSPGRVFLVLLVRHERGEAAAAVLHGDGRVLGGGSVVRHVAQQTDFQAQTGQRQRFVVGRGRDVEREGAATQGAAAFRRHIADQERQKAGIVSVFCQRKVFQGVFSYVGEAT